MLNSVKYVILFLAAESNFFRETQILNFKFLGKKRKYFTNIYLGCIFKGAVVNPAFPSFKGNLKCMDSTFK